MTEPRKRRSGMDARPTLPEWRALARSFRFAFAGLWWVLRTQRNMRIHAGIALAAYIAALALHLSIGEFAILTVMATLVLCLEMINTVVEAAVDLASPEYHPLAKAAKDVAAGAVLVSAAGSIVVGLLLFVPHIAALLAASILWPLL